MNTKNKIFAINFIYPHWFISIYLVKFYFDFVHIIGYWLDWFSLDMQLFSMLWYKFGLLYQIRHIVIVFYDMLIKKKNETLNFLLYLKINHPCYKQLQNIKSLNCIHELRKKIFLLPTIYLRKRNNLDIIGNKIVLVLNIWLHCQELHST